MESSNQSGNESRPSQRCNVICEKHMKEYNTFCSECMTFTTSDMVNSPAHYTQGNIECIEAIEEVVADLVGMEAMCTGNAIKYLWRWKHKNGVEDLKKAKWYIERLIDGIDNK